VSAGSVGAVKPAHLSLFPSAPVNLARGVVSTPEVDEAITAGAAVAIGVSGGKDSDVLAFETIDHLDRAGHHGPRILIHADLGRVEWRESAPQCERLAARLGLELVTVRRDAGDMMDRWLVRWSNNVDRYVDLECVKVILPWSTASMRFCTSELKTAVICRELVRRFPGHTILSACGIRRQESPNRRKAPIAKDQAKLASRVHRTRGIDWHPILDWTLDEVIALHEARGFPLHEAYTVHGSSRVSCAFCILGSRADILASAGVPDHADLYREMVGLEVVSSFAFQGGEWLGDVAPRLLTGDLLEGVRRAKEIAAERERLEAQIPEHLLYTKGWPTCIPTDAEARLLGSVRREVGGLLDLRMGYLDADEIVARYSTLFAAARAKDAQEAA
jgi:3'-phosphoadenosine 5'-phosphosulfate sulfotransferase (PAPS reductase)/FAD synthetase